MPEHHLGLSGGPRTTMAVLNPALLGNEKVEAGVTDQIRG